MAKASVPPAAVVVLPAVSVNAPTGGWDTAPIRKLTLDPAPLSHLSGIISSI
jgi:hypothetical protein